MNKKGVILKLRLAVLLLAMVSLVGSGINPVLAQGGSNKDQALNLGEGRYYDEETGQTLTTIYEVTEDGLKEVSFEEFKRNSNKSKALEEKFNRNKRNNRNNNISKDSKQNEDEISMFNGYFKEYDELSTATYIASPDAVSNEMGCPTYKTQSCSIQHSYSVSESETFSTNVEVGWESYIKAGAGFSWSSEASTSSSYTITIDPGATGQVMFKPYYDLTMGYFKQYYEGFLVEKDSVEGYSPQELSTGELKGYVYGVVW